MPKGIVEYGPDRDWPWFVRSRHERTAARAGVYRLIHTETGHYYIGSTIHLHRRLIKHLGDLRHDRSLPKRMRQCFKQSSRFDLQFMEYEIIEDIEELRKNLQAAETKLLQEHVGKSLCLNVAIDARRSALGRIVSDETKKKLSLANKGKKLPADQREAAIARMLKYAKDPEMIKARAERLRGRKLTSSTKMKMSIARKGRKITDEHKKNISSSNKGKVRTPEQRAEKSASMLGRKLSEETKAKMRARHVCPEHKEKMQEIYKRTSRSVMVNGTVYSSTNKARLGEGISSPTLYKRLRSPDYPNYKYVDGG